MEWNYFLLILINSLISQSRAHAVTIEQNLNWFEANNVCVNKGGRLAYPNELHPRTCANKSINIWMGKYNQERLTPWIAKQGCYARGNREVHSVTSLLKCYRLCKSRLFGFKEPNWCSCTNDTSVLDAVSPCLLPSNNNVWLYDSTYIDLRDDDNTMDCLSAQCTDNGTVFRPVNCGSQKVAYCQNQNIDTKGTQTESEKICNGKTDYLISKQICLSLPVNHKNTPEFWTGMRRYRYNEAESLTGYERQQVNSTDIFHCAYLKCPLKSGLVPVEHIENCIKQLDGFACNLNDTSNNITTVKPSPDSSLESTIISSSNSSNSIQFGSTDHFSEPAVTEPITIWSKSAFTRTIDMSTTLYNSIVTNENVITLSEINGIHSSTTWNSTAVHDNLNTGHLLLNSPSQSTTGTSVQLSTIHPTLPTSVNLELISEPATQHVFSDTISITSISVTSNEYDMSTTANKSIVTNETEPVFSANIVISRSGIILPATIISSSESSLMGFGSISMNMINVQPESTVEIGLWSESSISTNGKSSITSFIVPTSAKSDLMYTNTSKLGYNASINTSPKSTINSNTDISSRIFTSDRTKRNEIKKNNRTSTRNNPSSDQLSTGLIVGISVSILCLVVLIVGVFGICRLRKNQHAFNKKSLDFSTPNNPMHTTKYHDSIKETNLIEKDTTHSVVSAKDDQKPFRLTDDTSNSNTNKPNDEYAVVEKKPVTNTADNTSNSKTTKYNQAQDEYAVVVKIPEKDLAKDEQTSLDIPESTYDSTYQPRSISDNESGNIYDTSTGHCDESDPT